MSATSPVGSISGSTTSTTPAPAKASTGLGTDDFLKLMVAQLKNQDPMNPASSTEFLAQTAQFTSVEKLTQLVQQYTDLITAQKVTEATGLLGHIVGFTDANGNPTQGIVDSVRLSSGGPVLRVGNADVPLASISTITG